jgi:hypothetical protein
MPLLPGGVIAPSQNGILALLCILRPQSQQGRWGPYREWTNERGEGPGEWRWVVPQPKNKGPLVSDVEGF